MRLKLWFWSLQQEWPTVSLSRKLFFWQTIRVKNSVCFPARNEVVSPILRLPRSFAAPSLLFLSRLGFAGKHFSFVLPSPTPFPAPPPLVLFFCFSRWLQRSMYLRDSVQKRLLCRLEQKEWLMSLSFEGQVLFEIVGRNSRAQYRALNIFSA